MIKREKYGENVNEKLKITSIVININQNVMNVDLIVILHHNFVDHVQDN